MMLRRLKLRCVGSAGAGVAVVLAVVLAAVLALSWSALPIAAFDHFSVYDHCRADAYWNGPCRGYDGGCYHPDECYREPWVPPRHRWRREEWDAPRRRPEAQRDWSQPMATPPPPERKALRGADEPDEPRRADSEPDPQDEDAEAATPPQGDALANPRREAAENNAIPRRFRDMRNTVGHTVTAIAAGAELYQRYCATCHGPRGAGDGPRAQRFSARMPDLGYTVDQDHATDAYLIWTIMQGGVSVGTEKPGFEDTLSERQAWQIIAYLRAGLPEADGRRTASGLMPSGNGEDDEGEAR